MKKQRKHSQSAPPEGRRPEAVVIKDFEFARNELAQAQDARSVRLQEWLSGRHSHIFIPHKSHEQIRTDIKTM